MEKEKNVIFYAVVLLTLMSAVAASAFAAVPLFFPTTPDQLNMVSDWFSTLTYIFTAGAGAILGMVGSR